MNPVTYKTLDKKPGVGVGWHCLVNAKEDRRRDAEGAFKVGGALAPIGLLVIV
jgi:hypothetical protein